VTEVEMPMLVEMPKDPVGQALAAI